MMKIDLRTVPFSRFGSYLVISLLGGEGEEGGGAANLKSDHARLLIPSVRFEEVIGQMLGDWDGLGGTKTTEEVLQDARTAAESVDFTALAAMEDRFR